MPDGWERQVKPSSCNKPHYNHDPEEAFIDEGGCRKLKPCLLSNGNINTFTCKLRMVDGSPVAMSIESGVIGVYGDWILTVVSEPRTLKRGTLVGQEQVSSLATYFCFSEQI